MITCGVQRLAGETVAHGGAISFASILKAYKGDYQECFKAFGEYLSMNVEVSLVLSSLSPDSV